MNKYKVLITEKLQKKINVFANSKEEAESKALLEWKEQKHVLDSEHFVSVTFEIEKETKREER